LIDTLLLQWPELFTVNSFDANKFIKLREEEKELPFCCLLIVDLFSELICPQFHDLYGCVCFDSPASDSTTTLQSGSRHSQQRNSSVLGPWQTSAANQLEAVRWKTRQRHERQVYHS